MVVFTSSDEYICPIPPARLFKALVLDSHNLIPKIMPQAVKSIEIIHGDGKVAGSIKQINVVQGQNQLKSAKIRVDKIDEEKYVYNHSLIEGEALMEKLEYISYEVQFEPTAEGGSKNKMISKFHTKGDIELNDAIKEEIKARKDRALIMYKAVEAYLIQNPEAYA